MEGSLDALERAVLERLRGMAELTFANVVPEDLRGFYQSEMSDRACTVKVLMPQPCEASEFSDSPVFSKVAIGVKISADLARAPECPSLLEVAEIVSKALHFWSGPSRCGYAQLRLNTANPWTRSGKSGETITVNFVASATIS